MYSVSERYKEEIQKPQRITRIIGRILTAAGADYTITDSNVVTGSLKITDQLGSGEFSIGGVYSRNMTVKLLGFSNVSEVSNLSNARVILRFRLVYGVGEDGKEEYEDVPLGIFNVDGSKTKRKFDTVTITATDNMQNFDRDAEPNENITLYNAAALACERCGVAFATSAEDFAGFTNGDLTVTYTTDQIQTWHDLLMWIGELTGTFARINLGGALEFVKMKAETGSDGRIIPVTEIPPDVRFTTDFSDTNIRVLKVIMRRDKTELSASSSMKITSPSTMVATMELSDNPLIADKTDEEVSGYLKNLADYLVTLLHRPFETSFNGNPALQVGDYVRLKGGAIDISQAYATGIITYSCWRYRGKHDIKCRSFTTTIRQSDTSGISLMSADDNIAVLADTPPDIMRKPKSQLEKELDALRMKVGSGGVGKAVDGFPTSEYFNDYKNHFIYGDYSHAEGEGNKVVGNFVHIEGKGNTAMNGGNCNHIEGEGNDLKGDHSYIGGKNNTLGFGTSNHMSGSNNSAENPTCSTIGGQNNKISVMIRNSLVNGLNNVIKECYESIVLGSDNNVSQISGTVVAGSGNKGNRTNGITAKDSVIFGTDNIIIAPNTRVLVFGQGLKTATTNSGEVVVTLGKYNSDIQYIGGDQTSQRNRVIFTIGNGTGDETRSNGFLIDELGNVYCNRVYETGTSNIEDFLSGNTAQVAQAITAASDTGIPIKLLDHAPIAEDLTGSPCAFLQCGGTAEVEGETTGIFRVTDIFAEK